jgi:hypothetical protein
MPSSRPSTIPFVISVIRQIQPDSILDVGVGFGKWGYLFREYTDIVLSENDPGRYAKSGWKTKIEGVEGFPKYLHEGHRFIYDKIHEGNASDILPKLGKYDVIFFGDIIEHFTLADGKKLLRTALDHANACVMLTTPKFETNQGELCENPLERHLSLWNETEFQDVGPCKIALADNATFVVAFPKTGAKDFKIEVRKKQVSPLRRATKAVMNPMKRLIRGE